MKLSRSVGFKIALSTCLFVLAVIGLMAQRLLQRTEEGLTNEMQVRADFFARSVREAIFPKIDPFSLHFHVDELLKEKAVTYAGVVDANGTVLSHSDPKLIGDVLRDPISTRAVQSSQPLLQRYQDVAGTPAYDVAIPIFIGTRRIGTARLGFNQSSIEGALAASKRQILLIAAAAVLLTIFGTTLIVGWITRPLPRMAAAAREVGKGNFDVKVDWKSQDEIGVLAKAFNDMTVANALLFATIRQEKEKLATIFHDTQEGLVWTDASGSILLINPSARYLFGCQGKAVDSIASISSAFTSKPSLPEILAGKARITPFEFERTEPKLLILSGVADRLGTDKDPAGLLFIFHDGTLAKRGEALARNFLSLISHKLKTPLGGVLGFVEILQGDSENMNAFQRESLGKIQKEGRKLQHHIEELITFSTVQHPDSIALEHSECTLKTIIDEALESLDPQLDEKKVSMVLAKEDIAKVPKFSADAILLTKVFGHLIDNALKFNHAARKEVRIGVALQDSSLRVSVQDNGPGIPSEEFPKLFKRFYQIDEHFTGQIPGMGLGLAFVKNVIEAHGGQVGLRSEVGKGSDFFFILPLKTGQPLG